ncbi:MAG TPA: ABC transporter permease [Thermoanaerobaculia bacterium]|nr:ABC transporter permease [Thermoanaerobaculia bacterium]
MRRGTRTSLAWGTSLVAMLLLIAALAPWLAPYDPDEQLDPAVATYRPPGTSLPAVQLADGTWRIADRVERVPEGLRIERLGRTEVLPAAEVLNLTPTGVADRRFFLLGSDKFGRDILSRMLWGARVSLMVGLATAALSLLLGVIVGATAALGGRWIDALLMRGVDALLSFPQMLLMVTLVALFQPGSPALVLLLAALGWMGISRLTRAEILGLKQREFILAARAIGQRPFTIFRRHLLPNALTPVLIQTALLIGQVILAESSLSFLGLGIQPPTPTWGNMLAEGRDALSQAWWLVTFPGAAISVAVVTFNLLGDGLRDALDPRG